MDTDEIRNVFDKVKEQHNIKFDAKAEQLLVARSVLNNRDVLGFLPTGYGKTLCAVIPTMVKDRAKESITLIVSPLISLIDDQLATLRKWNFTCAKLEDANDRGIKDGEFRFVLASPESVLKPCWRQMFLSKTWQSRLSLIVIDEAHCISEWGEEFRPEYRRLSELRSFSNVPIMALTATATTKVKEDICEFLTLSEKNTDVVCISSDRPNIFIDVRKKTNTDNAVALNWLIDHIKEHGYRSKKIIVYCRSIDTVSDIFLTMKECLGTKAYKEEHFIASNLLVEMFHKMTHPDSKDRILSEFKKHDSTIRCVIATVALGMGLNISDIDLIVHVGCPKSVLSYWQETGRCARDGRRGMSVILYDNFTLAQKSTGRDIAAILKTNDRCVRQQVLDVLTIGERKAIRCSTCASSLHSQCECSACKCCSICCSRCPCQEKGQFGVEKFIGS